MDPETLIVALRKNAVLVVMHVVLGTIIGLVFGLLTPAQYTSTANANLSVENSEANPTNTFNYLTSIMPTLVEIGTSESTFADVSKTTGISQEELRKSVSVTSKTGTTLVEIRTTSTEPERAHRIAEAELTALDTVARDLSNSGQPGNTTATLKVVDSPHDPHLPLQPVRRVHRTHRGRHRPGRRRRHGDPAVLPEPEEPAGQGRGPVAHHRPAALSERLLTARGPVLVAARLPRGPADAVEG